MCGTNVFTIDGDGYSLLWYEGEEDDLVRIDWDHGVVVTPPEQMFHQHFNTGNTPSLKSYGTGYTAFDIALASHETSQS